MHIPDGFLDAKTIALSMAVSLPVIGAAAAKTRQAFDDRQIPKMSVMAAFVFAAQMINFPIAGGTSGHLIGAALAAIMLGPWSAILIMTTVLAIQAFVFLDGGVTALGANILINGIIPAWIGWWIFSLMAGKSGQKVRIWSGAMLAGWVSIFAASFAASLLIAFSGFISFDIILFPMLGWHSLIGIGEGIITSVVLVYISQVKSELVFGNQKV